MLVLQNIMKRAMQSQVTYMRRTFSEGIFWAFPITAGALWFIWPFLDHEDLLYYNLMSDPEAEVNMIHEAKMKRLEAYKAAKGILPGAEKKSKKSDDDEEEEEEEEQDSTEEESDDSGEAAGEDEEGEGGEDGEEGEGGDEEGGDEEEEEEEEEEAKPEKIGVFAPLKGAHLTLEEQWDNFLVKAVNYGEEEEEDEDEEGDDE
ncbi:hypothetical protein ACA910_007238 [Epithemia clementina (nom. ined.)]